jgi:ribosomal protein S19E (S16A)
VPRLNSRVGFLPWQKVFLPGQWKKLVKTGNNRQKPAKTGKNWKTRSMLLILGLQLFLAVQKG